MYPKSIATLRIVCYLKKRILSEEFERHILAIWQV